MADDLVLGGVEDRDIVCKHEEDAGDHAEG
jgi:hypothetical protein